MTGMAMARLAVALLLHLLLAASCCAGRDFLVGWTTHPAEPFNHWAERNRFQVNDTLVFRYNGHSDSVLVVSQSHYDACNTTAPFLRLEGGHSVFGLSTSGPYFFISGDAKRCRAGERLIVVVLAVRPGIGKGSGATPSPPSSRSPPKSTSPPPSSPPPVPAPASQGSPPSPPPPPAAGNSSSTPPALAPPPVTNATVAPPPHSPSSASALRSSVLLGLVIAGVIVLA